MIRFRVLQIVLVAVGCTCWATVARVQGLIGVRPLAGYACMWVMDGKAPALVHARPSARSGAVGVGGEMVIATAPLHLVDGFGEVLSREGRQGWIAARSLRPYESANESGVICTPSVLSDGGLGFTRSFEWDGKPPVALSLP
jgi:hypothetical protein